MSGDEYRHKWWGWGSEATQYDMDARPDFWPWIRKTAQLDSDAPTAVRIDRTRITLPPRVSHPEFEHDLTAALGEGGVQDGDDDRLLHAYGRSFRDLVRLRSGIVPRPPDLVAYPESHDQVEAVVTLAARHGVTLIPFGGGTNIVGCVEPDTTESRMVVTLDMRCMDQLLAIDHDSNTATLQTGMFGPQIEEALNAEGYALGHHPDSFVYSTLGGWIATRSAGTQSNAYGKIEDMVVSLRVVTPTGSFATKPLPAAANGPDVNRLIIGSEGTLGIITEATMRVHPMPEHEEYRMVLFRTYGAGVRALHECVQSDAMPSLARLSDEAETELMFAAKYPPAGFSRLLQKPAKAMLKARGYDRPAALVVAFEGAEQPAVHLAKRARRILRKHGGFDLGTGPGDAWKQSRYDIPVLRDYLMDYGIIADSFETATAWTNVLPLYRDVAGAIRGAQLETTGFTGYVGCHLSHLYDTGACLYYTVGVRSREGSSPHEITEQYTTIKAAATDAIMAGGGALSHHHAIGYEHRPWLREEITTHGIDAIRAVKKTFDPTNILNPATLLPHQDHPAPAPPERALT